MIRRRYLTKNTNAFTRRPSVTMRNLSHGTTSLVTRAQVYPSRLSFISPLTCKLHGFSKIALNAHIYTGRRSSGSKIRRPIQRTLGLWSSEFSLPTTLVMSPSLNGRAGSRWSSMVGLELCYSCSVLIPPPCSGWPPSERISRNPTVIQVPETSPPDYTQAYNPTLR